MTQEVGELTDAELQQIHRVVREQLNTGLVVRGVPDNVRNAALQFAMNNLHILPRGGGPEVRIALGDGSRLPINTRSIRGILDALVARGQVMAAGPDPVAMAADHLVAETGCDRETALALVDGKVRRRPDGELVVQLPPRPADGFSPTSHPPELVGAQALNVLTSWARSQLRAPAATPAEPEPPEDPAAPGIHPDRLAAKMRDYGAL